jgi:hypothetical protein
VIIVEILKMEVNVILFSVEVKVTRTADQDQ